MQKKGLNVKKSSRLKTLRFLLNANISRNLTSSLSKATEHDFIHITQIAPSSTSDEGVITLAKSQKRVIITHDLDYGEIYYLKEQGKIGVIQLRLSDQTSPNTFKKLLRFFKSKKSKNRDIRKSLIIISDKKTRIFSSY